MLVCSSFAWLLRRSSCSAAVTKLIDLEQAFEEFSGFGLSAPIVLGTIGFQLLGGVAIALGPIVRITALLLAVFTAFATLLAHRFWSFGDGFSTPQATLFLEHAVIIGGLLLLAALGAGRFAVTPSIFQPSKIGEDA